MILDVEIDCKESGIFIEAENVWRRITLIATAMAALILMQIRSRKKSSSLSPAIAQNHHFSSSNTTHFIFPDVAVLFKRNCRIPDFDCPIKRKSTLSLILAFVTFEAF